ncbi:MAG: STAS domain-containing protein [Actinomycetota bacterium]|nr:STAS domain-containing protein [Actinomycetota bacterium]MDQ5807499.1 STAS domain-containing protein [Actinomycetota bacterium]
MAPFEVTDDEVRPRVARVTLHGELDLASAYAFDRRLLAIEQTQPRLIVVDLRELTMMDSAGLARLVSAQRRARRGGWQLVLVRGGRAIQRVLQTTQLDEHFHIARDLPNALGELPAD